MSLSLHEKFRRKMCSIVKLYEFFVMKDYMQVQSEVIQNLARHFGYTEVRNINSFLTSPIGAFSMKAFRNILIDRYGKDIKNPLNPNTDSDPGFFSNDKYARDSLVRSITNDIIILYNKEKRNV